MSAQHPAQVTVDQEGPLASAASSRSSTVFQGPGRARPRTSSVLWYPFTVSARALS